MQKKSVFKILGVILILVSLIMLFSQFYGNVQLSPGGENNLLGNWKFFIWIVIFVFGVLMMSLSDKLQDYLGEKERESESPSLHGKKYAREDEKHFKGRYSGKRSFSDWFTKNTKVERVDQNDSKYVRGDVENYPDYLVKYTDGLIRAEKERRAEREQAMREIPQIRKRLSNEKKELDKAVDEDVAWRAEATKYTSELSELEQKYKTLKMNLPSGKYHDLYLSKLKRGFEESKKKLLRDLEENNIALGYLGAGERENNTSRWAKNAKTDAEMPSEYELRNIAKIAKTIPISEISKEYGVRFVHGIPLFNSKAIQNENNPELRRRFGREGVDNLNYLDFLKLALDEKPAVSASTITKDEGEYQFWSPVGIILKEGKIYDAEGQDTGSKAISSDLRLRTSQYGHMHHNKPINERIREAISNKTGARYGSSQSQYNEFIIKGDYDIDGLYFMEKPKDNIYIGDEKEVIRNVAKMAVEKKLPLYQFKPGTGFDKVNAQDYLKYGIEGSASYKTKRVSGTTRRKKVGV